MKHAFPPLTKDLIEAYAASAVAWLGWLLGVVASLGVPRRSRRLRSLIEVAERAVECIMFLRALHRFGPLPRWRHQFPRSTPVGFRRAGPHRRRRQFFRDSGVCARKAGLGARVVRLVSALADPEPYVAYFFKRLLDGLRGAPLLPVAPPAAALDCEPRYAVLFADSS